MEYYVHKLCQCSSGVASGYSRYSLNTLQFSEKIKNCIANGK